MATGPYRISVIMGIYNCAPTLAEALDSLLAQTYQGFKVIMCDDGSSDDTFEVAQSYVDRYPGKFILIRNERNMGLNYTLNRALQLADTEYIARMDGDDISLPQQFMTEINFLDSHHEYSIVSAPMIYFDENGDYHIGITETPEPSKESFVRGTPFCHAPCMVRREAYEAVGGYSVDDKLLRVEDYHLWLKMNLKGFRGYNLPEPLYKMRNDRNAYSRRTLKYRINEAYVKRLCVRELKLPAYYYFYTLIPLAKAICPTFLAKLLRK